MNEQTIPDYVGSTLESIYPEYATESTSEDPLSMLARSVMIPINNIISLNMFKEKLGFLHVEEVSLKLLTEEQRNLRIKQLSECLGSVKDVYNESMPTELDKKRLYIVDVSDHIRSLCRDEDPRALSLKKFIDSCYLADADTILKHKDHYSGDVVVRAIKSSIIDMVTVYNDYDAVKPGMSVGHGDYSSNAVNAVDNVLAVDKTVKSITENVERGNFHIETTHLKKFVLDMYGISDKDNKSSEVNTPNNSKDGKHNKSNSTNQDSDVDGGEWDI